VAEAECVSTSASPSDGARWTAIDAAAIAACDQRVRLVGDQKLELVGL
jgi:hypothetical protein